MGSSPDDFKDLQSLLKLKRHERPPPRYFEGLSDGVIHRLRGPEGLREQSLLALLGPRVGLKAGLFYSLGVVCCGLALYGVTSLLVRTAPPVSENALPAGASHTATGPGQAGGGSVLGAEAPPGQVSTSTNPVFSPAGLSLPAGAVKPKPTPINFQPK